MKEFLTGILAGIFTDLGMGGGAILIVLLGIFTNLEQHILQEINLFFFIPTSIISIIMNIRGKKIDYYSALVVIIFGIVGTIIGSNISFIINSKKLEKYFGIFLIFISIFEVFTIIKEYIGVKKNNNIIKGG